MLISELFCMYVRHHFMNTLAYLAIISIFLLNYFDKNYMRFTLITTAIAVGCDLLWLISHSDVIFI
jgi:xanthine/uracil permease